MAARLTLDIITNATNAIKGLSSVGKATEGVGKTTQTVSAKIGGVAKAVTTGFAVQKVLSFTKSTIAAAGEQAAAQKRLAAVFKATGDTTGQAAKQAANYASTLSKSTGIQKPVIENSQAMLATFKNVSNATARQAGIFDLATKSAADLAAAGFGDMSSNAVQLGKALEDPTKGLAQLRRVGVTFSAAQQEQIKNMQKSGNLLGAQKMLLAGVQGQVGGVAEATATSGAKMAAAFSEVQAKLGTVLLPYVKMFKTVLLDLFGFVAGNAGWLTPIVVTLGVFAATIFIVTKAIAAWKAITQVMAIAQAALNAIMAANPAFLVVAAILAIVAVFVILYMKCEWLRAAVAAAWAGIQVAIQAVVGAAIATFNALVGAFQWVAGAAVGLWHALVSAFQAVISWVSSNWPILATILFGPFGLAVSLIIRNWSTITGFFSSVVGAIGSTISRVVGVITAPFQAAWSAVGSMLNAVGGWFAAVPGRIASALSGVFSAITSPFEAAWSWVQSNIFGPIKSVWNGIAGALNAIHISLKVPSFVPGIGGKGWEWNGPNLPMLASGGIVNRATLAVLGERGPEAVIPLGRGGGAVGGNTVLNVTVNVPPSSNPAAIGGEVVRTLKAYVRANGPISGLTA